MNKTYWLTGLPASGKTTLGLALVAELTKRNQPAVLLDGDKIRSGLCRDLGFSFADRTENVRRVAETAKILNSQGIAVVCSLVSPMQSHRALALEILAQNMCLVFVDCSDRECAARDPKGLWAKAAKGEIPDWTGIGQAYERPEHPDFHYLSEIDSAATVASQIMNLATHRDPL
jgi:adenylyl-sulfate kinase